MKNPFHFLSKRRVIVIITFLFALFESAIAKDDISFFIQGSNGELKVSLTGIDPLNNGFHYEGWAIVNEAPVSTGKFNINESGEIVDVTGNLISDSTFVVATDISSAGAIVITIEPAGDTDEIPAASKYLGGSVESGSANLSTAFPGAFGSDFMDATGKYILATPTNGPDTDENSGIWFLELVSNTLALNFVGLDSLMNGYHYEGWAIIGGMPYSTGKFNATSTGALVNLEGDLIVNSEFKTELDLSIATDVVLTIEPAGDNDEIPASTKMLGGMVTDGSADLNSSHPATLNNDYMDAAGNYILATPTNGAGTDENSGIWFLDPTANALQLSVEDFAPLVNGFHYEGWAIVAGTPIPTGKFNVSETGEIVDLDGHIIKNGYFPVAADITGASDIVITIEPDGDNDTTPAATKIVGGPVASLSASLNTSHPATLANDYSSAAGKYILATPTNGSNTTENSGIWFLDNSSGSAAVGLVLPSLPSGWKYEGWVVIDGMPVTSGTFLDVGAVDDAAPYSGSEAGPPFPGEDYLQNAPAGLTFPTDLAGKTAVISIEPFPDDSETPFFLKPLVGMIPSNATDHTVYDMDNNSAGFPTATATIMQPVPGLTLPNLSPGWKYEGWVVIDGMPVTSGTFTDVAMVDDDAPFSGTESGPPFPGEDYLNNAPNGLTFPVDLAGKTAVISIEPFPDDSPLPFTFKPLVGMIPAGAIDHTSYAMDNNSISFPTGSAQIMAKPQAGLAFAELPDGWAYEGWIVFDGKPVTTGKFTATDTVDWLAPFSGIMSGPPFPGEDFLANAPDGLTFPSNLAGKTAVISIEPEPDDSPAPFTLKPLVGVIPAEAVDHVVYEMANNAESYPSGWVELQDVTSVETDEESAIPTRFGLEQNYPNPFNPSTVIHFSTIKNDRATLKVYNPIGQEVATLLDGQLRAGNHQVSFNAKELSAGIYIYRLVVGNNVETRKMTLLK